ncbi:phospholipase C [Silvibacterium bohemicum]|uniref:Phospholipase C n=1 Tax=Silvibacterium bohemicum TaxID=1577686 RepID=A0A841JUX3_9BACT|nr:alkaline phosphatase family protein [Silvibacterium bohemicum]MBB6143549.1 phospholipase C [Silvibacterium bohemicum]
MQRYSAFLATVLVTLISNPSSSFAQYGYQYGNSNQHSSANSFATTTPIKHLVVIFDENISFDHYFGTYPNAANPAGEPSFHASPSTLAINGLTSTLLNNNPDSAAPFRLDRSEAVTCDNDNHYTDEQKAYNGGLINEVSELLSGTGTDCTPNLAMGYYDGNTVTALWNYAQHYAMSDNFFASTFGTTVMGHLNLITGQTHGATPATVSGKVVNGSVIANIDPTADDCSTGTTIQMSGKNVGDLLNAKKITWGWFYGDWTPSSTTGGKAQCITEADPHYTPFQYYASTANPHHLPPTSVKTIGTTDQANHQYALTDFWNAVSANNIPAVSFLKAPADQTGHPSTSSPLAEQTFLVDTINRLQESPDWKDMAILIAWDDSDGWYDHVLAPIVNPSSDPSNDALLGAAGLCGTAKSGAYLDRCGYGPRLPFLVISPFARENFVGHSVADQSSILRFIEDNWQVGRIGDQSFDAISGSILNLFDFDANNRGYDRTLILDPNTGESQRQW